MGAQEIFCCSLERLCETKIKSVLFCVLLVCLSCCDESVYYYIPADQKPFFVNGDTLIFSDGASKKDTFLVNVTRQFRSHDKKYNYEELTILYNSVSGNVQGKSTNIAITQDARGCGIFANGNLFLNYQALEADTLVNNKIIKSPTRAFYTLAEQKEGDITEAIYHPHYGIVKYKYFDEVTLSLILR